MRVSVYCGLYRLLYVSVGVHRWLWTPKWGLFGFVSLNLQIAERIIL